MVQTTLTTTTTPLVWATLGFLLLLFVPTAAKNLRHHRKLIRALHEESRIPEQYIVVFQPTNNNGDDLLQKAAKLTHNIPECNVKFTYHEDEFQAVSLEHVPDWQLPHMLEDPAVLYVEEDQIVRAYDAQEIQVQNNPTWGLDRLDEISLPLNDEYRYKYTGNGVVAFVVDTGIASHEDFNIAPRCGYSSYRSCVDGQGHGTHVAGTISSKTYGVAKDVSLYAVRVLDAQGEGSTSGVLAGIDYIRQAKVDNPDIPMVANLSLGGYYSRSLNQAVNKAVEAGVFFAVAAGNTGSNSCWESPASADQAVTVASSNSRDKQSDFSNDGSCVDIFAPGESITSLWLNDKYAQLSGTSMASPHVAGVAALYLEAHPDWTPAQVWEALRDDATADELRGVTANTPNLLLNTRNVNRDTTDEDSDNNEDNDTEDPVAPPASCKEIFSKCSSSQDCCNNRCTFSICWFW